MNLLVLGSHGCIGTAVCKFLKEKGHTVIPWDIKMGNECIDISSYKWITITDVANSIQEVAKELLQKDIIIKKGSMVGTFQILKNEPTLSKLNDLWTPTTTLKEGITSVFKTMI